MAGRPAGPAGPRPARAGEPGPDGRGRRPGRAPRRRLRAGRRLVGRRRAGHAWPARPPDAPTPATPSAPGPPPRGRSRWCAGALLADEPDAEWAAEARSAADASVAEVRRVAATAALATGQVGDAAAYATEALRSDPYDEAALRTLMRAHVAAGTTGVGAGRVRPGPRAARPRSSASTRPRRPGRCTRQLLREEPAPGAPAGSPRRPGRPGRGAAHAGRRAGDGRAAGARVVVVSGEPGVGKTALLDRWAARRDGARRRGAARPGRGRASSPCSRSSTRWPAGSPTWHRTSGRPPAGCRDRAPRWTR